MWCLKFARADLPELKGNKAIKHEWQKNTEIVNLRAHFVWLATIKWKKQLHGWNLRLYHVILKVWEPHKQW